MSDALRTSILFSLAITLFQSLVFAKSPGGGRGTSGPKEVSGSPLCQIYQNPIVYLGGEKNWVPAKKLGTLLCTYKLDRPFNKGDDESTRATIVHACVQNLTAPTGQFANGYLHALETGLHGGIPFDVYKFVKARLSTEESNYDLSLWQDRQLLLQPRDFTYIQEYSLKVWFTQEHRTLERNDLPKHLECFPSINVMSTSSTSGGGQGGSDNGGGGLSSGH